MLTQRLSISLSALSNSIGNSVHLEYMDLKQQLKRRLEEVCEARNVSPHLKDPLTPLVTAFLTLDRVVVALGLLPAVTLEAKTLHIPRHLSLHDLADSVRVTFNPTTPVVHSSARDIPNLMIGLT